MARRQHPGRPGSASFREIDLSHTFRRPLRPGRRVAALALAAATALIPLASSAASPAAAAGPDLLPLTIANDTGRGEAVFVYVLGVDLATGRLGYADASGRFTNWPAGANPPSPAPDVAVQGPADGGRTTVQVPRGMSGRVYFSFGHKLDFRLTPDGLVQPAPWSAGDPNRDVLFDWSEFTYDAGGLWLNSSQVDMFAVPHTVSVVDAAGRTTSTGSLIDGGRNAVIDRLRSLPAWAPSVQTRADGTVLRVLAPGKVIGALGSTYLDPYIDRAWNAYTSKTLTVTPFGDRPDTRYTGRTTGDVMTFTDSGGRSVASFSKPSTADVWGCDGRLGAPNDQVVGPIARTLCAALNRGTLGTVDTQPSPDASRFYLGDPVNEYAKAVHANMADGKAYAFAFDDVGNFESLVHDGAPRAAGITLGRFAGPSSNPPASGPSAPATSEPAAPSPISLVSNWNGKCVDVNASNFSDGVPLQVYTCNGTYAQKWVRSGGTLRSSNNLCMDVAGGGTADGTRIQLATCSGGPAQQFVLTAAGDLVNPQADKCVDIKDWNAADRAPIQLWRCAGSANQKWHQD
jgi:Beta-1,3-glucanase/Ricin-type beta-trefoil lectin domain